MPSSAVRRFTDSDDYAAAIRATRAEITVTGRGHFTAKLTTNGRAIISFRTHPGPSLLWGGVETKPASITRHNEHLSEFIRVRLLGAMSLPVEDMVSIGAAIAGCGLTPPKDALTLTPSPSAMAKPQRLHAAAGQLAEDAPEIIIHPEAAWSLEQALIEATVRCLAEGELGEDRSALRYHVLIMHRFRRAVEENPDQPLYIPEPCKSIGCRTGRCGHAARSSWG